MSSKRNLRGRNIDGILILDKPIGVTSNAALQRIKYLYQAKKAGHTGSLDKMASGLLPICLGEATKFSGFLLESDKHYQATCKLGVVTSTGDASGEEVATKKVPHLTKCDIDKVLEKFCGEIKQIPPMYSALKYKGQRLYQLAYKGVQVERKPRVVTIYKLILLQHENEAIEIDVKCSKGTYIRTLAEDIGEKLGCGAHVCKLRRLGAGPFNEAQMTSFKELELLAEEGLGALDKKLLPIDSALSNINKVELAEETVHYFCEGQAIIVANAPAEGYVRIYDDKRTFLGLGEVLDDGKINPRRLIKVSEEHP